jgi:hypothetical protein
MANARQARARSEATGIGIFGIHWYAPGGGESPMRRMLLDISLVDYDAAILCMRKITPAQRSPYGNHKNYRGKPSFHLLPSLLQVVTTARSFSNEFVVIDAARNARLVVKG